VSKHDIASRQDELEQLKQELANDTIFEKSSLRFLANQIDNVYGYYYNLIDSLTDNKQISIINDYCYKFIDIDSIINTDIDRIQQLDSLDSRDLLKAKLIDNEFTLINRIKSYYENQDKITVSKMIRVNPTIKKGSLKKIILFVPKSYNIILNDSGGFYSRDKFIFLEQRAERIENDSICFTIYNNSVHEKCVIRFNIYE
jgi:hypothetical protein